MADSTEIIDGIINGQGSQDLTANAVFEAMSKALLYGRRASTSSGLIFGYYGGKPTLSSGSLVSIAHGTATLSASTTNYLVAQKSDGVVSVSTATTNWDDTANYWRLYSVVTGTATVTSYLDYREPGKMTGSNSLLAPVTKTTAFTVGANENEIIVNGGASVTVTLPTASSYPGRKIRIKTRAAYTVISASSNVKPLDTDTAGTAILAATAGKWAELVSDGSNWVIMAGN